MIFLIAIFQHILLLKMYKLLLLDLSTISFLYIRGKKVNCLQMLHDFKTQLVIFYIDILQYVKNNRPIWAK